MQYSELEAYIISIAPKEMVKCSAIDIYKHESFGSLMSLTLKLQFQSTEKTLEEESIAAMIEALLKNLQEHFGIALR
jgi:phenylalanyl-tRNA synthetase beta chain